MGDIVSYEDVGFLTGKSSNTIMGYGTKKGGSVYVRENGVPYPEGMVNLVGRIMKTEEKNSKSSVQERRERAKQEIEELGIIYDLVRRTLYGLFRKYIGFIKKGLEKGRKRIDLLKKILEEEDVRRRYPHFSGRELNMSSLDELEALTLKKINYVKKSMERNSNHKKAERQAVLDRLGSKYRAIYDLWKKGVLSN